MSVVLRAMIGAVAQEYARIQQVALQIANNAPVSQAGLLQVPTANANCLIQYTNVVTDPQGLGDMSIWSGGPNPMAMTDTPPPDWEGYVRATATSVGLGLACSPAEEFDDGDQVYAYVLVRCPIATTVTLRGQTSDTTYDSVSLPAADDWRLVPLTATLGATEALSVHTTRAAAPVAGDTLDLTAVTFCDGVDPGGPFCGDNAAQTNQLAAWSQGRNASSSVSYGRQFDVTALRELESNLGVAPLNLTLAQRQQYLLQRFQSRHQPYSGLDRWDIGTTYDLGQVVSYNPVGADSAAGGTTSYVSLVAQNAGNRPDITPTAWAVTPAPPPLSSLISQIGDLIRTASAGYPDSDTTITVDYVGRSYAVQIHYDPEGALLPLLTALIDSQVPGSIVPCHLAFDGLSYGGFLADYGEADIDAV